MDYSQFGETTKVQDIPSIFILDVLFEKLNLGNNRMDFHKINKSYEPACYMATIYSEETLTSFKTFTFKQSQDGTWLLRRSTFEKCADLGTSERSFGMDYKSFLTAINLYISSLMSELMFRKDNKWHDIAINTTFPFFNSQIDQ